MDQGVIVSFDADRGFGFIRSSAHDQDVFAHASVVAGGRSLRTGQRVRFDAEPSDRGPRAVRIVPGRVGLSPALAGWLGLGVLLALGTIGLGWLGLAWPLAGLAALNLATMGVYAWDKHHARQGGRRVPERVLLGLALIGGTLGATVGMLALRHKTSKPPFLLAFAGVVAVQALALVAWFRLH